MEEPKWWIGNDERDPLLPIREEEHEHRCACILIDGNSKDWCNQSVFNPDQPLCDQCEASLHHLLPTYKGPAATESGKT